MQASVAWLPGVDVDCEKALYKMFDYMDGEVTWFQRVRLRRHFRNCYPCADELDFEITVQRIISVKCQDEAPAELRQRIWDALCNCEEETAD